jgi:hypothetical protein
MMRTALIVSTALLLVTSFQSADWQEAIPAADAAADAYRTIRDMENFGPHYQDAEKSSIGVNLWEVDPAGAQPVTVGRDLNSGGDKLYSSSPGIEPVEATIEQTR